MTDPIQSLINEVSGIWSAFEHELRPMISHTNYNVLQEKLEAAKAYHVDAQQPTSFDEAVTRMRDRCSEIIREEYAAWADVKGVSAGAMIGVILNRIRGAYAPPAPHTTNGKP